MSDGIAWGFPSELEDVGVLICLYVFHVFVGFVSVSLRIPVLFWRDGESLLFTTVSGTTVAAIGVAVLVRLRRLQRYIFTTDRFPISIHEATSLLLGGGTLSVMEWLTVFIGQMVGISLCWDWWLGFPVNHRSAVETVADIVITGFPSVAVIHTLLMAIFLFGLSPVLIASSRRNNTDGIFFVHLGAYLTSIVVGFFLEHFRPRPWFAGLTGVYLPAQHAGVTFAVTTLLYAVLSITAHALVPFEKKKRET